MTPTGPIVRAAGCIVFHGDEVLLVHHVNSKHPEDIYGFPGGKIEQGETEVEAARRELQEETGLITSANDLLPLPTVWHADVTYKNGSTSACTMSVFLCTHYEGELRGTETEIPEWVPLAGVKKLRLLPNVDDAIQEARTKADLEKTA